MIGLACLAGFLMPSVASAAACDVPAFDEKQLEETKGGTNFPISAGAVALVAAPIGFDRMTLSSHAAVLGYPNGSRGVIGLETTETVAFANAGTTAADFYRGVFDGADATGCEVLAAFELTDKDYRVKLRNGTVEVFAFGQEAVHHFYAIRDDSQDVVIAGRFNGIDRATFEAILASIVPL